MRFNENLVEILAVRCPIHGVLIEQDPDSPIIIDARRLRAGERVGRCLPCWNTNPTQGPALLVSTEPVAR